MPIPNFSSSLSPLFLRGREQDLRGTLASMSGLGRGIDSGAGALLRAISDLRRSRETDQRIQQQQAFQQQRDREAVTNQLLRDQENRSFQQQRDRERAANEMLANQERQRADQSRFQARLDFDRQRDARIARDNREARNRAAFQAANREAGRDQDRVLRARETERKRQGAEQQRKLQLEIADRRIKATNAQVDKRIEAASQARSATARASAIKSAGVLLERLEGQRTRLEEQISKNIANAFDPRQAEASNAGLRQQLDNVRAQMVRIAEVFQAAQGGGDGLDQIREAMRLRPGQIDPRRAAERFLELNPNDGRSVDEIVAALR